MGRAIEGRVRRGSLRHDDHPSGWMADRFHARSGERCDGRRVRVAAAFLCVFLTATSLDALAQQSSLPANAPHDTHASPSLELTSKMNLVVEYPSGGSATPEGGGCGTFVAGWAGGTRFDLILVIDTSKSTRDPSGADIDGDGEIGRGRIGESGEFENSDPGDSILAAEIAAARELLHSLHPARTRVGIVGFSGSPPRPFEWLFAKAPSAETVQPLTLDHAAVEAALDRMASRTPEGSSDFAAGIDRALAELKTTAEPVPSEFDRRRFVLFFSDGAPTLPDHTAEAQNLSAVLDATARARVAGVRIHTFAIGRRAFRAPKAVMAMAERSGGAFTPVRHPEDLVDAARHVVLGEPNVSLRNTTTGDDAFPFTVMPDGAFHGFVRLAHGSNRLEIRAESQGAPARVEAFDLDLDPNAPPAAFPKHLLPRRVAGLEECLEGLALRTLEMEREQAERLRRQLAAEIARVRRARAEAQVDAEALADAQADADGQGKRLEISVEDDAKRAARKSANSQDPAAMSPEDSR